MPTPKYPCQSIDPPSLAHDMQFTGVGKVTDADCGDGYKAKSNTASWRNTVLTGSSFGKTRHTHTHGRWLGLGPEGGGG